ncbi:MAG: IPT/TIG domain-containing protein [Planctomycetes bacterium]|nr:IPT/TIG domain-containing protein [Planctomycetota bacterium]
MVSNVRWTAIIAGLCVLVWAGSARADLVAHWALDEEPPATTDPDSIEDSGPEMSYHGTPAFPVQTIIYEMDGANDNTGTSVDLINASIDVPYAPELNPDSFTFCVWARAETAVAGSYGSVVTSRHDDNPNLAGYILYKDSDNNWNFWTGRPGAWEVLAGGPVVVGEWTHIALRFDMDTQTKTIFINGEPTTSATSRCDPNAVMDLHIGGGGDTGTQYYFDGSIDDAALYDIALDDGEILDIRDFGAESIPDNLVAHWRLDEPIGTTGAGSIEDSTGNGFDGDPPRGPFELGLPGANDSTGTCGWFRNVSIEVPINEALNPDSFTVTAWVFPETAAGYQSVITSRHDQGPNEDLRGYILYNDTNGSWAFWTGDGDPGWAGLIGPSVEVGAWQHLAISYDAGTGKKTIFFNGEEYISVFDQGYVPNEVQNLHIGAGADLGDQFRFLGNIDDVGLYDRALTEEDVQCVMDEGVAGCVIIEPPSPIVASVQPSSGPVEGGTAVTITGENFADGAEVRFGGVLADSVIVNPPTEITCTTPARTAGTVAVEVRNPDGWTGSLHSAFTFGEGPTITFIRGDTDGNEAYTVGDGVQILERLFENRTAYTSDCEETGDVDGNGVLTIGDAVWLFNYFFARGAKPAPPANTCGTAAILLGCNQSTCSLGG